MALDQVRAYFSTFNIEDRIEEHIVSTASVIEAAKAFNCLPAQIAKTIALRKKNGTNILVVIAGDAKIDNKKYKQFFLEKPRMLDTELTLNIIGHPIGGVCPFAVNNNIEIYLDLSLKRFDFVIPACGSTNSGIKLSIEELELYAKYIAWIDVATIITAMD